MINTTFLESFIRVARTRSFTQAALHLHSTQATVSARIAALEADLGVKLFDRDRQGLRLTSEGLRALPLAEAVIGASTRLRDEVSGPVGETGTLHIGITDVISSTWIADLLKACAKQFPRIGIELTARISPALVDALEEGRIDLAIVVGSLPGDRYVGAELCTYAWRWVASPSLALGDRPVTPGELARHPIIALPAGTEPRATIERLFQGVRDEDRVIYYTATSIATSAHLASEGLGVALVPPVAALDELERGELVIVDCEQPVMPMRIHALYPSGPGTTVAAVVSELAREVALRYCRSADPEWAWARHGAFRPPA